MKDYTTITEILEELDIPIKRLKSVTLKWEKIFPNKAFPRIKIKLFNDSNEKNE